MNKSTLFVLLIFIFHTVFFSSVFSKSEIIMVSNQSEISLKGYIYKKINNENCDKIECLILSTSSFELQNKSNFQLGYDSKPTWFKINIFAQDNQNVYLFTDFPNSNQVDFYWVKEGKVIKHTASGIDVPFNQREDSYHLFNSNLEFKKDNYYQVYVRMNNKAGSLNASFYLKNKMSFENYLQKITLINIVFFVLLFLVILVAITTGFILRMNVFYYYSFYLCCIFMVILSNEGWAYKYLWPNSSTMAYISKALFAMLAITSFINFIEHFLTPKNVTFKNFTVKISSIYFFIFSILFLSFFIFINNDLVISKLVTFLTYFYLLGLCIIFYYIKKGINDKSDNVKYLAYSFIPICLFSLVLILKNYNIIPYHPLLFYSFPLAITIEVGILFYAIIKKIHHKVKEATLLESKLQEIEKEMIEAQKNKIPEIQGENIDLNLKENIPLNNKNEKVKKTKDEIKEELGEKQYYEYLELKEKVKNQIINEKHYLDSELCIKKLAVLTGTQSYILSAMINKFENQRFSDYINTFRINEAKEMLISDEYFNLTIEGISQKCGFFNKNTFYTAFKKQTNCTPKEFMEAQSNKNLMSLKS